MQRLRRHAETLTNMEEKKRGKVQEKLTAALTQGSGDDGPQGRGRHRDAGGRGPFVPCPLCRCARDRRSVRVQAGTPGAARAEGEEEATRDRDGTADGGCARGDLAAATTRQGGLDAVAPAQGSSDFTGYGTKVEASGRKGSAVPRRRKIGRGNRRGRPDEGSDRADGEGAIGGVALRLRRRSDAEGMGTRVGKDFVGEKKKGEESSAR